MCHVRMIRLLSSISVLMLVMFGPLRGADATINGVVRERGSAEVVIGATVALHRDSLRAGGRPERGTYSNRYGYYALKGLREGRYTIVVTAIGYSPWMKAITIGDTTTSLTIDVEMTSADVAGHEIVVQAEREGSALERIGTISISPDFISNMPSFGGEVDVFRALQLLPGVKASTELSSGLYVRGGSPDQNLILLDGVVVYNPSHLGGFLSSFHADALRDIKLIKGAFPAEYGGRLSSVLDLTMKEGNAERIKGSAHISMIAAGATVDGPITEDVTFMVSGRRFYADIFAPLFVTDTLPAPSYYFYDLNAKLNWKINERDRIYASAYFGRDVLAASPDKGDEIKVDWGNATANLRWTHLISPGLFASSSFIYTDYIFGTGLIDTRRSTGITYNFNTDSRIRDIMLRTELQWTAEADHLVKAGVEATHHRFIANAYTDRVQNLERIGRTGTVEALDAAAFIQDEWTITDALSANIGGRLYWFQTGNYLRLEPRVSLAWTVSPTTTLTASAAMAHQFLHLIIRNDIALPTDLWFPSTPSILPGRSIQAILGLQQQLFDGDVLFTAEGYIKDMQNLYEYKENAQFTLGLPLESQFTRGKGIAYGVEMFLNKRVGKFTGWIGYTLAWTTRTFAELNGGRPFYPRYDRRHDISVVGNYKLNETWSFGATWTYGTGQAYTVPVAWYPTNTLNPEWTYGRGDVGQLYTERNGYRIAPFHKLDLQATYSYEWFGLPFQLSLNIYNIYNRRNPFALYADEVYNTSTGQFENVIKQLTLFPIIPTLGLRCTF